MHIRPWLLLEQWCGKFGGLVLRLGRRGVQEHSSLLQFVLHPALRTDLQERA